MDQSHEGQQRAARCKELERQVERGSMFTQAVFQKSFTRLSLVEAVVREIVEVLVERGVVAGDDLAEARRRPGGSEPGGPKTKTMSVLRCAGRRLPSGSTRRGRPAEPVDCAARMAVCQAVCCRLKFALSQDEMEQRPRQVGHRPSLRDPPGQHWLLLLTTIAPAVPALFMRTARDFASATRAGAISASGQILMAWS